MIRAWMLAASLVAKIAELAQDKSLPAPLAAPAEPNAG